MTEQERLLNKFLVQVFWDVLRLEDASLRSYCNNLSVSELHVLEAIEQCQSGGEAIMTTVAKYLSITAGTLTASVKTLEQKGYITRTKAPNDRRRVILTLTQASDDVLRHHASFHQELIQNVAARLTSAELEIFAAALGSLHQHFQELKLK